MWRWPRASCNWFSGFSPPPGAFTHRVRDGRQQSAAGILPAVPGSPSGQGFELLAPVSFRRRRVGRSAATRTPRWRARPAAAAPWGCHRAGRTSYPRVRGQPRPLPAGCRQHIGPAALAAQTGCAHGEKMRPPPPTGRARQVARREWAARAHRGRARRSRTSSGRYFVGTEPWSSTASWKRPRSNRSPSSRWTCWRRR